MSTATPYADFLAAKVDFDTRCGYAVEPDEIHPILKPHQRDIVQWAVRGGRRAIFAAFGMGKSIMQLETLRLANFARRFEVTPPPEECPLHHERMLPPVAQLAHVEAAIPRGWQYAHLIEHTCQLDDIEVDHAAFVYATPTRLNDGRTRWRGKRCDGTSIEWVES